MSRIYIIIFLIGIGLLTSCQANFSTNTPVTHKSEINRPAVPEDYAGMKSPKVSQEDIKDGERKFIIYCASCHGETGKGDGPASLVLSPKPSSLAQIQNG